MSTKWHDMPPEERAKRWSAWQAQNEGTWLDRVIRVMKAEGIGWGSAMEKVRQQEQQQGGD
jgi:hypothetical protein